MPQTLKTKTARGGYRHDIATSWNSKLLSKRTTNKQVVPMEQLYREIEEGCRRFWARRDTCAPLITKRT